MRTLALAFGCCALALLAGCRTQARTTLPERLTALPAPGPAAPLYSTAVPAGPSVQGSASGEIDTAVRTAAQEHQLTATPDPRLATLAAWTATHASSAGLLPPEQAIDAAARHLGLVEPTPHFIGLTTNATEGVLDHLLEETRRAYSDHAYSHYGGCVRELDGQRLYVIALSWRWLSLSPVERHVELGQAITLEGELTQGYNAPELAVTAPDGEVTRGAPGNTPHFALSVPTRTPGVYQVELLGQGKLGIEVLANFPVYAGVAVPTDIPTPQNLFEAVAVKSGDDVQESLALLNRERTRAGLRPLLLDAALSEVAKGHDLDMLEHNFVGHTSPTTGSTVDRLARAGIRSSLVLENIGRDSSVQSIHAGLMNSPGHRGNILHAQATHVGIAVVTRGEGSQKVYLITQVFIRVSQPLPSDAATQLLDGINKARSAQARKPVSDERALSEIASRAAAEYFRSPNKTDEQIMSEVRTELGKLQRSQPRRLGALLVIAGGLDDIAALAAVLDPALQAVGVGLAQGTRPTDGFPNAICGVLLLAE